MSKTIFLWVAIFTVTITCNGQEGSPTSAPATKSFVLAPDGVGAASSSVNLFTGDVSLPITLMSVPGRNGLDMSVGISYSSNVQDKVDIWNLEAPAGVVGLGWQLDFPKIVADTKQTGTREDDSYYLIEGGSSSELIRTNSGSDATGSFYVFELKRYQFWKIKFYYDPQETTGGAYANKWEIVKDNGFKFVYGDRLSGRNTVQYMVRWNNWIGNSSQIQSQSQIVVAWNLSEVINLRGEKVLFAYDNVEQFVGSAAGQKHTEASYLTEITDQVGRKIKLVYKEKAGIFFIEPHTEANEPDAYQEIYERKYLDHVEAFDEAGSLYSSVYLKYDAINASSNTAKMLLAHIEQRNAAGEAMRGVQFEYSTTGTNKGFLTKVTYPTGGTVSYTYAAPTEIGHSERKLTVNAPAGYKEPRAWIGPDYVVLAWREVLGGVHDTIPRTVKLYVYEWVGEWKEQFLQTIGSVSAVDIQPGASSYYDYKRFQVVTEERFFAVLTKSASGVDNLFIRYKDESARGTWGYYTPSADFGGGSPRLTSGRDFVAVGSFLDDSTHPSHLYTFQGNSFKDDVLNQTSGDHSYTSSGNYFISHNRLGTSGSAEINFHFLDGEKRWQSRNWGSPLLFGSTTPTYWHGSNSFAVALAGNNPEYIYEWDLGYNAFTKQNNVLGTLNDDSFVFNIGNSQPGAVEKAFPQPLGEVARYDGKYWYPSATFSSYTHRDISFGEDFVTWIPDQTANPVVGYRRSFNPNTLAWSDQQMSFTPDGSQPQRLTIAGNNFFIFDKKIYFRKPDGTWSPDQAYLGGFYARVGNNFIASGGSVQFIKNGTTGVFHSSGLNGVFWIPTFTSSGPINLIGSDIIVTFNSSTYDANSVSLHRVVGYEFLNKQKDQPVIKIAVSDGTNTTYASYDYDFATASVDKTGQIACYYKVTSVNGSETVADKPFGSTVTYNHCGLSSTDLGVPLFITDLRWLGAPYKNEVFNKNGDLVASSVTILSTITKDFNNSAGFKVDVGAYVRPYITSSSVDGVQSFVTTTFDESSGQIKSQALNYATGGHEVVTEYVYWWEKYDPTRSRNILTGVVQTSKLVNGVYRESGVVRWKNWTASLNSSTEPAPYDNLTWKGTGAAPNLFANWDPTIQPGADWQIESVVALKDDNTGVVYQQNGKGNAQASVIWDQYHMRQLAVISNAPYSKVAYASFEDASKGNWSWTDGTINTGPSKTGARYMSLGTGGLSKVGLNPAERYVVSFWAKGSGGAISIDGVTTVSVSQSVWTLFEYEFSGVSGITIRTTGSPDVQIDEVRLFPARAAMVTSTYHPVNGVTSRTDENNQTSYTEYDEWGRVRLVRDENGNIIKVATYYTMK